MKKAPPRCCASPTAIAIAAIAVTAAAAFGIATAVIAARATAPRARKPWPGKPRERRSNGHGVFTDADPSTVLPPAQDLPVLGRQCPENRLQGREAAAALRLRAWQDRTEPHHGGFGQEAARARAGDQARAISRPADLRDKVDDR